MTKSLLLINIAIASMFFVNTDANAQTRKPWENNKIFAINKEAPHASLFPFQSCDAKLARTIRMK